MRERRSDSGDPELSPAGDPLQIVPLMGEEAIPRCSVCFWGVSSLALPSTLPQPEDTLSWRET